jgi:hypothetical protein
MRSVAAFQSLETESSSYLLYVARARDDLKQESIACGARPGESKTKRKVSDELDFQRQLRHQAMAAESRFPFPLD